MRRLATIKINATGASVLGSSLEAAIGKTQRIAFALAAMLIAFAVATPAYAQLTTPVEFLTNGNFETGDRSGWTVTNTGSGAWRTNDGSFNPTGPGGSLPPIQGNFDQVSFQGGPGQHRLAQTIVAPVDVGLAILSWSDRIRNHAFGVFSDPNQEWRVLARDTLGAQIQEIFSTNPGDPTIQIGPNARAFDVTALLQSRVGLQTVFSFEQQDNLFFFNATLDAASLQIQLLDEDNDTITDSFDFCLGTAIPEALVPSDQKKGLLVNRFALTDGDTLFDTVAPYGGGKGPQKSFDITDTAGCSCEQIIVNAGLGKGHEKFGCSISAIEDWIEFVNQ